MNLESIAKAILIAGLGLTALGGLIWLAARLGLPLGRLPGDIRIKGENFSFHFPVVTGLLISVILTIVLNLMIRLIRK